MSESTSGIDTYIDSLGIDIEDLYAMDDSELENFYESKLNGLSDEEITELQDEIATEMSALYEELYVQQSELENIIDSNDSSVEEVARAEVYLDEITAMLDVTDDFSSDFGDAQTSYEAKNVDATDGGDVSFTAENDVANGDEYVIDATSSDVDDDTLFEDPHADDSGIWVDTDGDGYTDTLAADDDESDTDIIADYDTNEDGVIDETDLLDSDATTASQTVTINLDQDDTIELASYDSSDGSTRWKITKEDGTIYYLTIQGAPDIRFSGDYIFDTSGIESSWNSELLNRVYESSSIETSFGELLGVESDEEEGLYYTIVDLADQTNNTYTESVSVEDIENGRDYTINCNDSTADTIDLTFPDEAVLTFSPGDNDGDLVITVTYNGYTSTITINDYSTADSLYISGGSISNLSDLGLIYLSDGSTFFNDSSTLFFYEDVQINSVTA